MPKRTSPIAGVLGLCLSNLGKRQTKEWDPMRGWKPMPADWEIPTVIHEFPLLLKEPRLFNAMNVYLMASLLDSFRTFRRVSIGECTDISAAAFNMPSGDLMVLFPRWDDVPIFGIRLYVTGGATMYDCSVVLSELVLAFEEAILGVPRSTGAKHEKEQADISGQG